MIIFEIQTNTFCYKHYICILNRRTYIINKFKYLNFKLN